jgi:hypothetical protein
LQSRETRRRLLTGRTDLLVIGIIALVLAVLIAWPLQASSDSGFGGILALGERARSASAILGLIGTILMVSSTIGRSLLSGSARAARAFADTADDPMDRLKSHFTSLVDDVGQPILVLIDDVDRCQREYVVRLLEGIQTLFSDRRVIYVVAGDRRWLHACFESTYSEFLGVATEPGRRLGALFVEKAFQLAVPVPQLPPAIAQSYLKSLLTGAGLRADRDRSHEARLREQVKREVNQATTLDGTLALAAAPDEDPLRLQLRQEAVVERLASMGFEESTKFFLMDFAHLVESNPRSMKRLLHTYGALRDIAILSGLGLDPRRRCQLALWTILCLRWPPLEDYFVDVAQGRSVDPSETVRALLGNPGVRAVIDGTGVPHGLDLNAIRAFVSLHASDSPVDSAAESPTAMN